MIIAYTMMCLIYGTSYFAIKVGLSEGIPPFFYASVRFFLASILILAVLLLRNKLPKLRLREYGELAFLGFLMTTIPFAALFWAEQHISSGTASLLCATAPIFTTIISLYVKQMSLRWYVPIGLLISISGILLLVGHSPQTEAGGMEALVSKLAVVLSELFFSYGAVRSRSWVGRLSPLVFNGYQMLFASLGLLLLSSLTESLHATGFTAISLGSIIYLAILVSIVASTLYYWLVRETNAAFPTTWTYVAPVIATAIGALFLGESLTASGTIGSCAVLIGVILLNGEGWAKLRQLRKACAPPARIQDDR